MGGAKRATGDEPNIGYLPADQLAQRRRLRAFALVSLPWSRAALPGSAWQVWEAFHARILVFLAADTLESLCHTQSVAERRESLDRCTRPATDCEPRRAIFEHERVRLRFLLSLAPLLGASLERFSLTSQRRHKASSQPDYRSE